MNQSWTKKQIILQAYLEIGLGDYIYNLTPEELNNALMVLEMMISEWETLGVVLGYPTAFVPSQADINEDSHIPMHAMSAVCVNLGVRLAVSFGKVLDSGIIGTATNSFSRLLTLFTKPTKMNYNRGMVAGAGNKGLQANLMPFIPWRSGCQLSQYEDFKICEPGGEV
jgi:hypothetical protein